MRWFTRAGGLTPTCVGVVVSVLFSGALATTGCTTTTVTAENRTTLSGRVYDENGVPVSGVRVETGRFSGVSDDTGRFRLDDVPHGDRVLEVFRRGYETQTVEIALHSPHAFARISLWSLTGLIDQAIQYLREGVTAEAQRMYDRSRAIDPHDERVVVLGAIVGDDR
jgi:hypothetical protein